MSAGQNYPPGFPKDVVVHLDFTQGEWGVRRAGAIPSGVAFADSIATFTSGDTITMHVNLPANYTIVKKDEDWNDASSITATVSGSTLTISGTGTLKQLDIYGHTLTTEELSLIADKKYNTKPSLSPLLDLSAQRGVLEDKAGNSFTNTNTTVKRSGSVWNMLFDGSAKIAETLSGSYKAVAFWVKADSDTEGILEVNGNDTKVSSGTLTAAAYDDIFIDGAKATALTPNEWHHVIVRSDTDLTLGALTIGMVSGSPDTYFHGKLSDVKILSSLSDEEATNIWSASKHLYQ